METYTCPKCGNDFQWERPKAGRSHRPKFCGAECRQASANEKLKNRREGPGVCESRGCSGIANPGSHMCGDCRALYSARTRASAKGLAFNLTRETMPPVPEVCPILGMPLVRRVGAHGAKDNSPSLDRIIPELGYVVGNVRWLSYRANRIKNDSTPEESWLVALDAIKLIDPPRAAFLRELNAFAVSHPRTAPEAT